MSCSHELSAQLNGPKRAVTAVLNARLIPIVDQLVATVTATLTSRGITAPVMVVRGDGSLVSAAFVRERPIETILSGPAASLVGAAHLTGLDDAVISDIGGTTTDIAVLRHGRPVVSNDGATVGGHHTMVRAVAMRTHGLGGDSEVVASLRASGPKLLIGPRRVIPLSSLAVEHHECVTKALRSQLAASNPSELAGVMLVPAASFREWVPQSAPERELRLALADGPTPAMSLGVAASKRSLIDRLVRQGLLMRSSFTPTDACHVLGLDDHFDRAIARLAAEVFARHRDALGRAIAADAEGVAEMVVETLVRRSAEAVLAAAFVDDGLSADLASSELLSRSFDRATGSVRAEIGLRAPLVGLGASAATYYPRVAALARTSAVIPIHAHVANAVGAVVGRVTITRTASVQSPAEGVFVTHLGDNPTAHTSVDAARIAAESRLRSDVAEQMRAAGAGDFEVSVEWDERAVDLSGLTMFVEGTLTVTASGRPDLTAVAVRTA